MTAAGVNPYCAGAGTRPGVLAGRGRQLTMVERLIAQFRGRRSAENIVWTGLRGMGKTALLKEALDRFRDAGWCAGYTEARRNATIGLTLASVLAQAAPTLGAGRGARPWAWLREMAAASSPATAAPDLARQLGIGADPAGASPAEPLDALFVRLGESAADAGGGAVFVLDELQLVRRTDLAALLHASQAAEGLPVAFVAAGLPDLAVRLSTAGTYSERLYYDRVDWLSEPDVVDAITGPAAEFAVTFTPDALERLVAAARSYPFFVQLFAEETWWQAGAPSDRPGTTIDLGTAERGIAAGERRLDEGIYRTRLEKASPLERQFLDAMAAAGDQRIAVGDVAGALGRSVQALSPIRDRLIGKGLIYAPSHGRLDFAVPGFADYLRRRADA